MLKISLEELYGWAVCVSQTLFLTLPNISVGLGELFPGVLGQLCAEPPARDA